MFTLWQECFPKTLPICLPVDEWHKHHMTTFQSYKSISETTAVVPILKDVCGNMIFISCRRMSETTFWLRNVLVDVCQKPPYDFLFHPAIIWPIFYIDVCQNMIFLSCRRLSESCGLSFLLTHVRNHLMSTIVYRRLVRNHNIFPGDVYENTIWPSSMLTYVINYQIASLHSQHPFYPDIMSQTSMTTFTCKYL